MQRTIVFPVRLFAHHLSICFRLAIGQMRGNERRERERRENILPHLFLSDCIYMMMMIISIDIREMILIMKISHRCTAVVRLSKVIEQRYVFSLPYSNIIIICRQFE